MPILQVRDCPEDIYKKIAISAKKEKRTIAQQVLVILEKGLAMEQSNLLKRESILEKISQTKPGKFLNQVDDVQLIREDRDR